MFSEQPTPLPTVSPAPTYEMQLQCDLFYRGLTSAPTPAPSQRPTTAAPSTPPTPLPSPQPSPGPTVPPSSSPSPAPTILPLPAPSPVPTMSPSPGPTQHRCQLRPSATPTASPSPGPTQAPTPGRHLCHDRGADRRPADLHRRCGPRPRRFRNRLFRRRPVQRCRRALAGRSTRATPASPTFRPDDSIAHLQSNRERKAVALSITLNGIACADWGDDEETALIAALASVLSDFECDEDSFDATTCVEARRRLQASDIGAIRFDTAISEAVNDGVLDLICHVDLQTSRASAFASLGRCHRHHGHHRQLGCRERR